MSDLFYSNQLNFFKDTIRNATGFTIGAPSIDIIGEQSFSLLIPFYRVANNMLYTGTAVVGIDGPPITRTNKNGEVQLGFEISGLSAEAIVYGNLLFIDKYSIERTFPKAFIPLTTIAFFNASHDDYAYTYIETQQLSTQLNPIFVNSTTLKFIFQSKYASIN